MRSYAPSFTDFLPPPALLLLLILLLALFPTHPTRPTYSHFHRTYLPFFREKRIGWAAQVSLALSLSLSDRPLQILVRCPSNSHTLIRSLSWSLCNQSELNRSILSDFDFGGSLDRHQLTPCRKRPLRGPFRSTQPLRFYYPFLLTF